MQAYLLKSNLLEKTANLINEIRNFKNYHRSTTGEVQRAMTIFSWILFDGVNSLWIYLNIPEPGYLDTGDYLFLAGLPVPWAFLCTNERPYYLQEHSVFCEDGNLDLQMYYAYTTIMPISLAGQLLTQAPDELLLFIICHSYIKLIEFYTLLGTLTFYSTLQGIKYYCVSFILELLCWRKCQLEEMGL